MAHSNARPKVGVFDSGLGGLSIASAIRQSMPGVDLAYCCDDLNFPYGTKSESQVIQYALQATELFYKKSQFNILVIACNTASVVALEAIRKQLPVPVVGVVPAVKPAALASRTKIIGILATPVTISRPYLDNLINEFASDCDVIKSGSSKLVDLAERKMRGLTVVDTSYIATLRVELEPIIAAAERGLDQLVLGCTHFPLLADDLKLVLPANVNLVDSGQAVAKRVSSVLAGLAGSANDQYDGHIGHLKGFCTANSFVIYLPKALVAGDEKFELHKLT